MSDTVWVLHVTTSDGHDISVHKARQSAMGALVAYVRQEWEICKPYPPADKVLMRRLEIRDLPFEFHWNLRQLKLGQWTGTY